MLKELKVGMRVEGLRDRRGGDNFRGKVVSVRGSKAEIMRDDGENGGGGYVDGYGTLWVVLKKRDGFWGSNDDSGTLLPEEDQNEKPF